MVRTLRALTPVALLLALGVFAADVPRTTLITLYARDALAHTLCFADAQYGTAIQDGQVKNRCSDLDFGAYKPGSFSAGIEGRRIAAIVDVGTDHELAQKYGIRETVGSGQAFASLQLADGKLHVANHVELTGVESLSNLRPNARASIMSGHIYLVHIADQLDATINIWVKLLVVQYSADEAVTIRWQVL